MTRCSVWHSWSIILTKFHLSSAISQNRTVEPQIHKLRELFLHRMRYKDYDMCNILIRGLWNIFQPTVRELLLPST